MRASFQLVTFIAVLACVACGHGRPHVREFVFTGLAGEPDTLNPLVSSSADLFNVSRLYMSMLVESDGKGRFVPELAQTVPSQANGGISSDGRTVVYHLRPGLRWQDGAPLTARDVAFSYHAIMNPVNNVLSRVGYDDVQSLVVKDDRTIVVHLRVPFSPLVAYFFAPQGNVPVLPAHVLARYASLNRVAYNDRPVGSGPFRVVQWRHGDRIVFEANPLYWRGRPSIERMVYRVVPDANTRLQLLQTGESDAYFGVDPAILPLARTIPRVHITYTPVNDMHVLQFNLRDATVGDVRVRRAIAYAIDRKKLMEVATHGAGIPAEADQPRGSWARDPALPAIPYNPVRAAQLLDAAGWRVSASGIRRKAGQPLAIGLAIAPQGIAGSALVATVVQRYLRDVGIQVTIKTYPPGLMWEPSPAGGILAGGHYQIAYNAWWTLGPDPDDSFNFACNQIPPAGENAYFWCNARADAAMHAALRTFNVTARKGYYAVVQREIVRDIPELTLWQVDMPDALRVRVRGFAPSPAGSTFWNAFAWRLNP